MGHRSHARIDHVFEDPRTGELVLYLIESGSWPDDPAARERELRRIVLRTLDVVDATLDGRLDATLGDRCGMVVRIQVDSPRGCPRALAAAIDQVRRFLAAGSEYPEAIRRSGRVGGLRLVTAGEVAAQGERRAA